MRVGSWIGPLLLCLAACGGETPEADAPGSDAPEVVKKKDGTTPADPKNSANPDKPGASRPLTVHALANLGDSISQGFDADDSEPLDVNAMMTQASAVFHDDPAFSWIQG